MKHSTAAPATIPAGKNGSGMTVCSNRISSNRGGRHFSGSRPRLVLAHPSVQCHQHELGAICSVCLQQDDGDCVADGLCAHVQLGCNLTVGLPCTISCRISRSRAVNASKTAPTATGGGALK